MKKILQIMPAPTGMFAHFLDENDNTANPTPVIGIALVEEDDCMGGSTYAEYLVHGTQDITIVGEHDNFVGVHQN